MILGDEEIRRQIMFNDLVSGADMSQINPASINIRLGDTFLSPQETHGPIFLGDKVKYVKHKSVDSKIIIPHGAFLLATTIERIRLPGNISAFVQGRSSIGRMGLSVQNAGFVDPGFDGHITLELKNDNPNGIILRVGYPVAQLIFFKTVKVSHLYEGKYQGQVEATGSRIHLDKEAKR